jgi:hypothetical protein
MRLTGSTSESWKNWSSRQAYIHKTDVINKQFHYFSRPHNVFKTDNSKIEKHSLIDIVYIHIKPAHDTASLNNIKTIRGNAECLLKNHREFSLNMQIPISVLKHKILIGKPELKRPFGDVCDHRRITFRWV